MQLSLIAALLIAGPDIVAASSSEEPVFGAHVISQMIEGVALKPARSFYAGGYQSSRDLIFYRVHLYEHRTSADFEEATWTPWAIRLIGADDERRLQWVDGRTCPAIYGVQQALADLSTPRFRQPRFQQLPAGAQLPSPPPMAVHGGSSIAIWGYATHSDGAMGGMLITGQDGAIRSWVDFADSQLDGCWRDQAPEYAE